MVLLTCHWALIIDTAYKNHYIILKFLNFKNFISLLAHKHLLVPGIQYCLIKALFSMIPGRIPYLKNKLLKKLQNC